MCVAQCLIFRVASAFHKLFYDFGEKYKTKAKEQQTGNTWDALGKCKHFLTAKHGGVLKEKRIQHDENSHVLVEGDGFRGFEYERRLEKDVRIASSLSALCASTKS